MSDRRSKYLAGLVRQVAEKRDRVLSRRLGECVGQLLEGANPDQLAVAMEQLDSLQHLESPGSTDPIEAAKSEAVYSVLVWTLGELLTSHRDILIRKRVTDDLMALVKGKRGSDILLEMDADPHPKNGWTPSRLTRVSESTSRSNISHLLRRFRAAGLLEYQKQGRNNVYMLTELGRQCAKQLREEQEANYVVSQQSMHPLASRKTSQADVEEASIDIDSQTGDADKFQFVNDSLAAGKSWLKASELPKAIRQHFDCQSQDEGNQILPAIKVARYLERLRPDSTPAADNVPT